MGRAVGGALVGGALVALGVGLGVGGGVTESATRRFVMFAEQMTRDPPPLAELLHWLILTSPSDDRVPVAVHCSPTSVPPFAEPLHCVIVALVVVAGNGSQPTVMPPPEPTHWLTVAALVWGVIPKNRFVTPTLHLSVPPAPLIEWLHCVTAVTGCVRTFVVVTQDARGSPAAPWHSVTVTRADPPVTVILFTTVTRQIRPRPGVSST